MKKADIKAIMRDIVPETEIGKFILNIRKKITRKAGKA